jgi:hypothetical protein
MIEFLRWKNSERQICIDGSRSDCNVAVLRSLRRRSERAEQIFAKNIWVRRRA